MKEKKNSDNLYQWLYNYFPIDYDGNGVEGIKQHPLVLKKFIKLAKYYVKTHRGDAIHFKMIEHARPYFHYQHYLWTILNKI